MYTHNFSPTKEQSQPCCLRDEKSERLLDCLAFLETVKSPGMELHIKKKKTFFTFSNHAILSKWCSQHVKLPD